MPPRCRLGLGLIVLCVLTGTARSQEAGAAGSAMDGGTPATITADAAPLPAESLLAEGEPLGNWSWAGETDDDPNDIIPHEDRRELRATRLLTAWLNHYDTGDNQTLSMWIPTGEGRSWVRHHMIDWNDSLGFLWAPELDQISRRLGFTYYFDVGIIGRDFITLGTRQEPWDRGRAERPCLPPRRALERTPGGVCARIPADAPDYLVIDVYSGRKGQGPARIHVRSSGVVGLERPGEQSLPPLETGR